jgi:uncharacterized protein (DUF1778 family)
MSRAKCPGSCLLASTSRVVVLDSAGSALAWIVHYSPTRFGAEDQEIQMYQKKTIACRVFEQHHDIVHRAAAAANKSVDEYSREIIVAWAASDLKLNPPDFSLYRHTDVVAEAAKLEGVTTREFASRAAREAAMARITRPSEIHELRPGRVRALSRRSKRTGTA